MGADTIPEPMLDEIAERFRVLGDPNRLRILRLLMGRGEMTHASISRDLGIAASTVSAAIKALTSRRAVKRGETGYVAVR